MDSATVNTEEWALRLNRDLIGARARITTLEAQLVEAWTKEGFLTEKLKQAEEDRDTWKERAMGMRLSALEATPPAPKVTEWREITEDDQPPRDVPVLMGCWEKWPRDEWVVEFGLYGSTKGGWIHGRMTHWLPSSFLPSAPTLTAAQEAGKP